MGRHGAEEEVEISNLDPQAAGIESEPLDLT